MEPRPRTARLARQPLTTTRYAQRSITATAPTGSKPRTLRMPQRCSVGGILSPLIANVALSALDEHFAHAWQTTMATRPRRETIRRRGGATYRLVRYADDCVPRTLKEVSV
jgi:hypothetical protein